MYLVHLFHGLLMADVARYKADGSMLNKGRYCYSLRGAVTDVAEVFAGPGSGDIPRMYGA